MRRKLEEKKKAIKLREKGFTINEITQKLRVSRSSVSLWVRETPLNRAAKERLELKRRDARIAVAGSKKQKINALVYNYQKDTQKLLDHAVFDVGVVQILCSLIYWCEGTKNERSGMRFTNSDPELIRFFLKLLRRGFDIKEEKFRVCVHLHDYHNEKSQIKFWSEVSGIKENQFLKSYRKPHTKKQKREGYQGCISVRYYNNNLARNLNTMARTVMKNMIV